MFTKAIVKKPCPSLTNGITTANLGKPNYELALDEHAMYVEVLEYLGVEVTTLAHNNAFPDSTFVEDVALCTSKFAVLTNPGALTRREETKEMEPILHDFFDSVEKILYPGSLDAGDVMMVGDHFYIGISERTNDAGAGQLIEILRKYGMNGTKVPFTETLHLKSDVNYLENNNLLVTGEFVNHPVFDGFNKIVVDRDEAYAANSLWVNDTVIVPLGFPKTLQKIQAAGYRTVQVNVSEFQKVDGGLSCLSLRF